MPRDYTSEYATLAEKFKRASARATTEEQRARVRAVYDRAVTEVAESQQMEAEERRAAGPSGARQVSGAERARGLTRAAAQGMSFGFGEEAEALARSLAPGKTYGEEVKRIRGEMQAYREAEPGKAMAAEIAGGFVPGLGLATKAVQGVRGAGAVAKALTKSAGLQGALAGAGATEGGLAERGTGAAVGGVAGGATGYLGGRAAGAVARGVQRKAMGGGLVGPVGPRAAIVAAERAGITDLPDVLRQAQQTASREARVMDVIGAPAARMTTGVRLVGGRPGEVIGEQMTQRLEEAPSRLLRAIGTTGRAGENLTATDDALIALRKQQADPLYAKMREARPVVNEQLEEMIANRPSLQAAQRNALKLAAEDGVQLPTMDTPAGPAPLRTPESLHYMKLALDDMLDIGKKPGEGGMGRTSLSKIAKTKQEFLELVDGAVPEFKAARNAWAGPSAMKSALEEGATAAKSRVNVNELAKQVSELSDSEREFFQRGYIQTLRERVDDMLLKPQEVNSEGFAKRMRAVLGDEATPIVSALREEVKLTQAGQRVMSGSQTAERTQDIADIESGMIFGPAIRATGRPRQLAGRIADVVESRVRAQPTEARRMSVARTMMTPARSVGDLLDAFTREQAAQRAGERVRRGVSGATGRLLGAETVRQIGGY